MIHCHNCLHAINQGEPYRKCSYWSSRTITKQVIYVHYPHCPDGADPDAHYQQNVLCGRTEYNFVPEVKYIKEGI